MAERPFREDPVFWWFERNGQFMRCEAHDAPGGGYELVVTQSDGADRVERFEDSSDLAKRQLELERDLVAEGWTGPHGWNL
jgi:hypothetical protein